MSRQRQQVKFYVNGISPLMRSEYRRLRKGGFDAYTATFIVVGMARAMRIMGHASTFYDADITTRPLGGPEAL